MVVRMRSTRSHTGNRRSHHALRAPALVKCADCGALKMPHRVCETCGKYRGRVIIDVVKAAAKVETKLKRRAAEAQGHGHKADSDKEEAKADK